MILESAFNIFISEKETSCSNKTLIYYNENIRKFINFIESSAGSPSNELSCDDVTRELLLNYISYLRTKKKFSGTAIQSEKCIKNTSLNTYVRAVKIFINWCCSEDFIEENIFQKVKLPRSDEEVVVPLYQYEIDKIDNLFNSKTESGLRNLCIIHLMADAGLRSGEVIALRIKDVYFDKNILYVYGKGGKYRVVPLCPKLKSLLYRYCIIYRSFVLDSNDTFNSLPVFVKLSGSGFINENVIKQLFARIKNRSGIERVHPHLLRHTFATSYIMGGGNLEFLRMMLGHFDYSITRRYLHLANQYTMLDAEIYKLDAVFFKKAY